MKRLLVNPAFLGIVLIFFCGLALRLNSVIPYYTIIGFDQARDLFAAREILNGDIKIIGPTAGNNPNLHHGVGFWYYLAFSLLPGPAATNAVVFNVLINSLSIFVMYYFAKSVFNSKYAGFVAAVLTATSNYFVQYSGWLSNPTVTLVTVPLFFLFLWEYLQNRKFAFVLAMFFLGLTIQFELFFLYLIPIVFIVLASYKKWPKRQDLVFGFVAFCLATATMIATEIKYNFSGVLSILGAGENVGENIGLIKRITLFIEKFVQTFSYATFPTSLEIASLLLVLLLVLYIIRQKKDSSFKFILLYLLSPALMLILGFHNAPWFLVGLPPAFILLASGVISKTIHSWVFVFFLVGVSTMFILNTRNLGQVILEPDNAGKMQNQIVAIDYTYLESEGKPFTINTVTNPLYINAIWAYHYAWYGQGKYKYLPTWSGGDQLPPYNTLPKWTENEEYLYLIMDATPRIPEVHRIVQREWADKRSELIESKDFGGILVEKRKLN